MASIPALRSRVLESYRLSKTWVSKEPTLTETHRLDIKAEVQRRFRENKKIEDEKEIEQLLLYVDKRVAVGLHYGIPYERPEYLNPQTAYSVSVAQQKYIRRERKRPDFSNN